MDAPIYHFELPPIYGTVLDNNDPQKGGRIKVQIQGVNDDTATDKHDWVEHTGDALSNQHDPAMIGEIVEVVLHMNGIVRWRHLDFKDKQLIADIGDDYLASVVLMHRNLRRFNIDGNMSMYFAATKGFRIIMQDTEILFDISNNSIQLKTANKVVHIQKDHISLGTKTVAAEPSLLGDKTEDTLNDINDKISTLTQTLSDYLKEIGQVAATNPYTLPLAPIMSKFATKTATQKTTAFKSIKSFISKIKSKVVSLD